MVKDALFDIAATVSRLARPDVKPKDIIKAVRKEHPSASKKDVVRAAFYALALRNDDPEQATRFGH
ncbi:hypothetical protein [Aureimonas populi]|uniref:Spastin/Vps4 C-terminal domain-containing protein n=1 Tax=Aureimonas populi TaxID=1701758 RepID=A0ABW5CP57_9HYPH|nr:hypothetical protein [Aureimonas populi]